MILAGDIGGTNTRLALFENGRIVQEQKFPSRDHQSLEEIVREFLKGKKVKSACFGIAGIIRDGKCKPTNLPWILDEVHLSKGLHIPRVHLLNDLEANAYGIRVLKKEELFVVQEGEAREGMRALISAGTGLGEAGLAWDGKTHRPFPSEGGHVDFAPRDALEVELLLYLQKKLKHASYERVISGPGLHTLFQFLVETGKETFNENIRKEMEKREPPRVISEWGEQKKDKACTRAVEWFISLYGAEAGNVALKFLALGGVYIGGGIAPQLANNFLHGAFCSSFCNKGRFKTLLQSIPIYIIMNDKTALLGAASYAEGQ